MKYNEPIKLVQHNSKLLMALTPEAAGLTDKQAENLSGGYLGTRWGNGGVCGVNSSCDYRDNMMSPYAGQM